MKHSQFFLTIRGKDCRGEPIRSSVKFVKSKMETGRTEENNKHFRITDFPSKVGQKVSWTELRIIIAMLTLSVVLECKKYEVCDNTIDTLSYKFWEKNH
jgi:hypothetical protein